MKWFWILLQNGRENEVWNLKGKDVLCILVKEQLIVSNCSFHIKGVLTDV